MTTTKPGRTQALARPCSRAPSLAIVVVNWNTGGYLARCLAAVAQAVRAFPGPSEVVCVDNASSDGSFAAVTTSPVPVRAVARSANGGFARACNEGAAVVAADYLLFLNPDTEIAPDALARTVAFLAAPGNAGVGICGIQLVDEAGAPALSHSPFPTLRGFLARALGLHKVRVRDAARTAAVPPAGGERAQEVDQVIGAFFLIRRSLFVALGGFDTRFFVYFEEVDLALRAHRAGWRSVCLPDVHALHAGGGATRRVKATRLFYSLRSRLQFAFKHFPPVSAWALVGLTFGLELPARLAQAALHGSWREARDVAAAYRRLVAALPGAADGGAS